MALIERITDELDPFKDFDRRPMLNIRKGSYLETFETQRKNVTNYFLGSVKSILRGGLMGGVSGGIYGVLTNQDIENYARLGSYMGILLDWGQFSTRTLLEYVKAQISE